MRFNLTLTFILENIAIILFCGFLMLLVVPQILIRIFYSIPKMFIYASKKQVALKGAIYTVLETIVWLLVVFILFLLGWLFKDGVFTMITTSKTAVICWIAGGLIMIARLLILRKNIKKDFYETTYIKYATQSTILRLQEVVKYVDTLNLDETKEFLNSTKHNFLHERAIRVRLNVLEQEEKEKIILRTGTGIKGIY